MMANLPSRACRIKNPVLFICDIQEKFREHIYEFPKVVSTTQKLLKASTILEVPVYVTTQNKARLGDTVSEILSCLTANNNTDDDGQTRTNNKVIANFDKTAFSMYTPEIVSQYQSAMNLKPDPEQKLSAIIVGIETHICVTQTTLDLLQAGHRVYIVTDGVSSVNAEERWVALNRLRDAGAVVTTSESLIFELLRDAKRPGFKNINGLIKEYKQDTKDGLRVLCKY